MEFVLGIIKDYWGVLILLVGALIFLVSQGKAKALQILLSLMLRAEKEAEEYLLQTGDEKFSWVVERGYQLLPKVVRLIITYGMFEQLAKSAYDKAKQYLLGLQSTDDKPKEKEIQERKITDPG